MLDEKTQLQAAIVHLYRTFAPYLARRDMARCSHCVSLTEVRRLISAPLPILTGEEFGRYPFKAMTTWGDADDFRHFLPRLLELASQVPPSDFYLGIERVCDKLCYAQWQSWPQQERQAVLDYFLAFWRCILAVKPSESHVAATEYIAALGTALDPEDMALFLTIWEILPTEFALWHLTEFILWHKSTLRDGFSLKWWQGYASSEKQILAWLLKPIIRQQLEEGFFRDEQAPLADELAEAADHLFQMQRAYAEWPLAT